jgi:ABC-2 type transport system ATP-binding protein
MKRKLTIAAGIIHQPSILFLDEPTTGIDVASARQVRQLIADLHRGGTTIFLTTHYIEEAERLCDRIAFIVTGRIVKTDTVAALMEQTGGRHVVEFALSDAAREVCHPLAVSFPQFQCQFVSQGRVRVESADPIPIGPLVRFFEERGLEVTEARKIQLSLEEVFVRETGIEAAALRKEKEKAGPGQ